MVLNYLMRILHCNALPQDQLAANGKIVLSLVDSCSTHFSDINVLGTLRGILTEGVSMRGCWAVDCSYVAAEGEG